MRRSHMRVTWKAQPRRVGIVEKEIHAADAERLGG
jgi:hypothetical protein